MSRHKHKKLRSDQLPLPGEAGEEVLALLLEGKQDEALELFVEAFISSPGIPVDIQVLEDDGESLLFMANRGPFKVYGLGRDLVLTVKQAFESDDAS